MYASFEVFFDSHVGDWVVYLFASNTNTINTAGGFRSRQAATAWGKRAIAR